MIYRKNLIASVSLLLFLSACGKDSFRLPGERNNILTNDLKTPNLEQRVTVPLSVVEDDNKSIQSIKIVKTINAGDGSSRHSKYRALPDFSSGKLYVIDNKSKVLAISASSGNTVWSQSVLPEGEKGKFLGGSVVVSGSHVYSGTGSNEVLKLNASNGKIIWRKKVDAPVRADTLVAGDKVFVHTATNNIYALNAATGEELWLHKTVTLDSHGQVATASPVLYGDRVIAFLSTGKIIALNKNTGDLLWETSTVSRKSVTSAGLSYAPNAQMLINDGVLYAGNFYDKTVAINPKNGNVIWSKPMGMRPDPMVISPNLYFINEVDHLVSVNKSNGKLNWIYPLQPYKNPEAGRGRIIWFGPASLDGKLYVVSTEGHVLSIDKNSGKLIGGDKLKADFISSPVSYNGLIYAHDDNNKLIAFK